MSHVRFYALLVIAFTCFAGLAHADPAMPFPIEEKQPDGTQITIQLKGDEFYHWTEDTQGYTVMQDSSTKDWVYARQGDDGSLQPTAHRVGRAFPQTLGVSRGLKDRDYLQIRARNAESMKLPEPLKIERKPRNAALQAFSSDAEASSEATEDPANPITKKNLVVLVAFSDKAFITPNPQQSFDNLMNQPGYNVNGSVGSAKDFFFAASYGNYIVDSVVTHVVTADKTSAYYAGARYDNVGELVREVIQKLDNQGFNFRQCSSNGTTLDSLTIIYAGRGQSSGGGAGTIWPHASSIATYTTRDGIRVSRYNCSNELRLDGVEKMVGLGTIVHEVSHALFGLPDLYDTKTVSTHEGVGNFCLMGGGSHVGNGYTPPLWSAWCKKILNVTVPINLPDNADITILDSALNDNNIYKLKGPAFYTGTGTNPTEEYFLIENRNGGGFDKGLPILSSVGRGLLIWHIDERQSTNQDAAHLKVSVEEANGLNVLTSGKGNRAPTGVYFKASSNASYDFTSFTDATTPNS